MAPEPLGGAAAAPRVRIAGVPIAAVDLDGAADLLLAAPAAGERISAHLVTTHTLALAHDTADLRTALRSPSTLILPDGLPLVWVGRMRGARIGRVCGLDLMPGMVAPGRAQWARHAR